MKEHHYILYEGADIDWYKEFKTKSEAMSFITMVRTYVYVPDKECKIKYYNKFPTSNIPGRQPVKFPDKEFDFMLCVLMKGLKNEKR